MKYILLLLTLTSCFEVKDPKIDLDLNPKVVNTVTTASEMSKLVGTWSANCNDESTRGRKLMYGKHCGDQKSTIDDNKTFTHEFESNYFDFAMMRKVGTCDPMDEFCNCSYVQDQPAVCTEFFFMPGQCTLSVAGSINRTLREKTSGGLFGGTYYKRFIVMKKLDLKLTYLDPQVEAAVLPEKVESIYDLDELQAAKYSCVTMLNQYQAVKKSKKMSYDYALSLNMLFLFNFGDRAESIVLNKESL